MQPDFTVLADDQAEHVVIGGADYAVPKAVAMEIARLRMARGALTETIAQLVTERDAALATATKRRA